MGFVKGINLKAFPDKPVGQYADATTGSILYELVQLPSNPSSDIYAMEEYRPYLDFGFYSQIAVLHGDWIDAAKKYRDYRLNNGDGKFQHLDEGPYPSGHPNNNKISTELKTSPIQVRITAGGQGYCVGEFDIGVADGVLDGSDSQVQSAGRFDWMHNEFGSTAIPYVMFERFQLAHDEIRYDDSARVGYYAPSSGTVGLVPVMDQVRALMTVAQGLGHDVMLDGASEKFFRMELVGCDRFTRCCPGYDGVGEYDWCCEVDPKWRRLAWECQVDHNPSLMPTPVFPPQRMRVCPLGFSDAAMGVPPANPPDGFCTVLPPCPPTSSLSGAAHDFPLAFAQAMGDVVAAGGVAQNGLTGGFVFETPGPGPRVCYSTLHGHRAGYGSWSADAWRLLTTNIRVMGGRDEDFVFTQEGGALYFADFIRVVSPINRDFNKDLYNMAPLNDLSARVNNYFDAPIWTIPLLPMVADELRYCTIYKLGSLSLAYTEPGTHLRSSRRFLLPSRATRKRSAASYIRPAFRWTRTLWSIGVYSCRLPETTLSVPPKECWTFITDSTFSCARMRPMPATTWVTSPVPWSGGRC